MRKTMLRIAFMMGMSGDTFSNNLRERPSNSPLYIQQCNEGGRLRAMINISDPEEETYQLLITSRLRQQGGATGVPCDSIYFSTIVGRLSEMHYCSDSEVNRGKRLCLRLAKALCISTMSRVFKDILVSKSIMAAGLTKPHGNRWVTRSINLAYKPESLSDGPFPRIELMSH